MNKNLIYKDNKIIEASYKLSLIEQRIVLLAISQVNSYEKLTEEDVFSLTAEEYSSMFSVSKSEAFRDMKKAMQHLSTRWVKVIDDGNINDEISWISKKSSIISNQSIIIRFTKDISPYLSELEGDFTKYKLLNISGMTSTYSIRIYELMMRWKKNRYSIVALDDLRDRLQLPIKGYPAFGNIKQKILDPAMNEITRCSDIDANYDTIKQGRKVVSIKFNFNYKEGMEPKDTIKKEALNAIKKIKNNLTA
jgi:plasmid replication initiation protein